MRSARSGPWMGKPQLHDPTLWYTLRRAWSKRHDGRGLCCTFTVDRDDDRSQSETEADLIAIVL
jgi:hypothetical protein